MSLLIPSGFPIEDSDINLGLFLSTFKGIF